MVDAFEGEELRMRSHFDDTLVDDGDLVGALDGGQPMRYGDRSPGFLLLKPVEGRLHHLQLGRSLIDFLVGKSLWRHSLLQCWSWPRMTPPVRRRCTLPTAKGM